MKQTWNETVTVFMKTLTKDETTQRTVTTWSKVTVDDCFWGQQKTQSKSGTTLVDTDTLVCRLPVTEDTTAIKENDLIFLGTITDSIADNDDGYSLKQSNKGKWFEVKAVSDNSKLKYTKHIKVRG